jgi:hypothetical protein
VKNEFFMNGCLARRNWAEKAGRRQFAANCRRFEIGARGASKEVSPSKRQSGSSLCIDQSSGPVLLERCKLQWQKKLPREGWQARSAAQEFAAEFADC